jgi:CBS domain-containing protein
LRVGILHGETEEERMARTVADVMTKDPKALDEGAPVVAAAKLMRDADIGAVIVTSGDEVRGILTDRDIVVRAVADDRELSEVTVGELCTASPTTVSPDQTVDDALRTMEQQNVRRLPVVDGGRAVGFVSLGDLSEVADTGEAMRDIAEAPANN